MNPKAINDAYNLFASKGYSGNQDEFVSLISTNENAFNDAFTLFSSKGYSGGQDGFKSLMGIGVKKKDEQDSISVQEDMASVTPSGMEQDSLLEQSQSQEEEPIQSFDETLLRDKDTDTFVKSFDTITPELIGREEEFTVPKLNYQFNDYGFTFEETGIGDAMVVRAKNGSETRIDLDPFTGRGEREEAAKLKTFIQQNREESERLQRATNRAERKVRRVNDEQELKNTVNVFNQQTNALKDDMISFLEEKSLSDEVYETKFKGLTSQQIASDPKLKNQYNSWYGNRKELQANFNGLQLREQDIKTKGVQLDRIASEYTGMKAEQGTWLGGIYNSILKGFGVEASALSDFGQFVAMDMLGLELTDKDKKKDRIINEAVEYLQGTPYFDEEKIKRTLSNMSMDELEEFLSDIDTEELKDNTETRMTSLGETRPDEKLNLFEYSDAKVKDLTKKAIRYYDSDYESAKAGRKINPYSTTATEELAPEGINKALRTSIVDVLGDDETTEQWAKIQQKGFWGGAILGVAQSLPAMIGSGKFGSVQRIAQMTAQATDAISEEMENNPEFDNISEDERFYVKAPIGIAVGVLENIGFRNVINQKGLLNRAVSKALGKSNSKTTAKQFADFVREDVNSMMGRGLLTITGAGLAEFETGAAQELATLTVKEIYNQSKEKEMFKTPDTFYDWAKDIMYAGAQEAVGGFILGVPSAVAVASNNGDLKSISNEEFETFEMMSKDPEYGSMLIAKVKQSILDGEITEEEGKAELDRVNELQGLLNQIPAELTTETKKEALQLILEKSELEKQRANKEPLLVKKQTERINEINNEIEQLEDKSIAQKKEAEQKLQEAKEGVSVFEDTQESESTEVAATEETQEQKDIAEMFSEDIAEVETVSSNLAISSQGDIVRSEDDIPRVTEIIDRAKKAVVAVAKVLPQTKMILHESKDEFQRFTGTTGRGFFDPNTNTIHINLTDATQTTVPHEIFHAVLLNKIGTDTEVQVVVRDMVNSVAKVVKKGSVLSKRLDEFVSLYESEGDAMMNEERLAELTGILSANYSQLEAPQKSKVIEFIRKIASKFGIELGETFGQNDESVIDFLNTVSRKVAVGEEITDTDLEIVNREISTEKRASREQKPINQIIQESRDAGFKEDVIRDLLVRRLGMKARVVDNALAKFTDLFREFGDMPKSFGTMEGGLVASKKLFKKLQAFHRKEVRNNKRRKNKVSKQEIMDKTIDYMESLPEFKAEADTYVRNGKTISRQGYSTQQAQMVSDLQIMVNVRPTENVRQKVRDARKLIAEKRRRTSELKKIKYELRSLMRKTLPKALYTKQEALDLIQKIADADNSSIDNIIEEVFEFATTKNNQILKQGIDRVLAKKTTRVESGRLKGTRVSVRVKEAMDFIKSNLLTDEATAQQIDSKNAELLSEYNEIDINPVKSEDDTMRMAAIKIAIEYNNSLQMEDSDSSKTESLDFVLNSLKEIDELGRTEFQLELALEQEQSDSDFATAYEEITGNAVDMTDPDIQETLNKISITEENKASVEATKNKIKTILKNISNNLRVSIFTSIEALDGLIDLISRSSGEMFGGELQKITSELIDASSRVFKQRKMYVESLIASKLQELYGKNWQKETRKNGLQEAVTFGGITMGISQNQMYYWYNQFKDPANHGAFKSMFGSKYKEFMADLEAALDPKVKAFADWQVSDLFPQLYGHYNNTYRKIYKTNMPQNENYAGRIFRKGVEPEPLDLLGEKTIFNTAVGAASIKSRVDNNKNIDKFDGNIALFSYVKDMEYFAAYAEAIRRMNRMFNNKYITSAIETIHGKNTHGLIKDSITKIANQGSRNPMMDNLINNLNDAFIISRLALSPLITIKQLTSIFTYGNDIGIQNWLKYSAINLVQMRKTYKEMAENSVYMQDRGRQPITRAIEAYATASPSKRQGIIPDSTKNKLIDVMMYNVKAGDAAAIYLGGMPNYLYYKDQYRNNNPNATEQEVIDYAIIKFEKDTKRTQQSSDLQDKDYLQTSNPILRAFNMFMTTPRQYLRKEIQAVRNLYRKIKAWDRKAGKGTLGENIRTLMMYHFFMPMVFQYVSMGLPGLLRGWRDDDELDLLRAGFLGNLNAVFVLGEIAQWVSDGYAGKPYAAQGAKALGITTQAQRMVKLYLRAERTKDPEKREANFKKFYIESMMLTGLPAPTLMKFANNYSKIGQGDDIGTEIMRLLNYSDYQIEGPKNKKKKKMNMTIQEANEQYEKEQRKIQRKSKGLQNSGGYIPPSKR